MRNGTAFMDFVFE